MVGGEGVVGSGRIAEVEELLAKVTDWASHRPDVVGLALVGSWASSRARPDSDDLILLSEQPALYIENESWITDLPDARLLATRSWGKVTERRLRLPSTLEVEVGIADYSWAGINPVDQGTARVVRDGLRILYDPDGLLNRLAAACS